MWECGPPNSETTTMAVDLFLLEARYIDACRKRELLPNCSIMSEFSKVKLLESHHEPCILEIFLDHLKDSDFPPLIDVSSLINLSGIEAVDVLHESRCILFNWKCVLSLMRSLHQKLRVVDLQGVSFGEDFVRDLCRRGLSCQVLNLRSCHIPKLNMTGKFMQLRTLNLDFNTSLTAFPKGCFSCMPNLVRLSMCETRVANLWTTSASLSKLPSLRELRFQNCLCCNDTGPCLTSSGGKTNSFVHEKIGSNQRDIYSDCESPITAIEDFMIQNLQSSVMEDMLGTLLSDDGYFANHHLIPSISDELDFPGHQPVRGNWLTISNGEVDPENVPTMIGTCEMHLFDELYREGLNSHRTIDDSNYGYAAETSEIPVKKYTSHHPSPICFEKYYREYMVASLPNLSVLDNLAITNMDREKAKVIFSQYFEYLPYNRQYKENVVSILLRREAGTSIGMKRYCKPMLPYQDSKSQISFSRSISASKVGFSAWPVSHSVTKFRSNSCDKAKVFRPRQFEYHPTNPSLMVFGTLDGELVVVNHESQKLVGYIPSVGALHSVLGLCWLKKHPTKLIAGSDNGTLQLYDISTMPSTVSDRNYSMDAATFTFDEFEQLTSVHINATDEYFLASGYSKHVALYDIGSGKRLQVYEDLHREHINVIKFSHHSPSIFATSSFDQEIKMWDLRKRPLHPCYTASSSRGNVMVCFSPDDHYLLSSAVDNEVKQYLAVDGRLNMKFNIASTGSAQNYTRSYYMNGRDYIITGSCEENVVRVCSAETGRRLRDIALEGGGSRNSMFVQSLRGDPFRDFHMSILAAYQSPSSKSEIVKVNLLASDDIDEDYCYCPRSCLSNGMGG